MSHRVIGQVRLKVEACSRGAATLDRLSSLIDWQPVAALLAPLYPSAKGEPAWPPLAMFKALLPAVWYDLSDVKLAEALEDRASFRRFCGFAAQEPTPERTAFVRFRRALIAQGLDRSLFEAVTGQLTARAITFKTGTLVDATIIASASKDDGEARWLKHRGRGAVHAFVMDRESGVFIDPSKVCYANYEGPYVKTRGPLTLPPRTPQGRPVFLQAGASDRGRDFAARWAEMIFCTPHSKADAIVFHDDVKTRMERYGRTPGQRKVLHSFAVVVGETMAIARERYAYLQSRITYDAQTMLNSSLLGADLAQHCTAEALAAAQGNQGITGSTDRVPQLMRDEKISFAEAVAKPRDLLVGTA